MYQTLIVVFLFVAICLVTLIILQQSTHMDASLGIGASSTLFGSSGSSNFMTRMTAIMGTLFLLLSLILGNISSHDEDKNLHLNNLNLTTDMRPDINSALSENKIK